MTQLVEVKALHVFTLARRFLLAVDALARVYGDWHLIFVETSTLLFPIMEMIGAAQSSFTVNNGNISYPSNKLVVGLYWLLNPQHLITNKSNKDAQTDFTSITRLARHMNHSNPTVRDLYFIRNYYLHGIIPPSDVNAPKMEDCISFQLPNALAAAIEEGLYIYWDKLRGDDGKQGWLERLAASEIHPFIIKGSDGFADAGLIDPNIIGRIRDKKLRSTE